MILIISIILIFLLLVIGYLLIQTDNAKDFNQILYDFRKIKKKVNELEGDLPEKLSDIKGFDDLDISYNFRLDGNKKYILLNIRSKEKPKAKEMLKKLSKHSYLEDGTIYFSLFGNEKLINKPKVEIDIKPEEITPMTKVKYSYKNLTKSQKIEEVNWEGNKDFFENPGTYTVSLKVKNKKGIWSKKISKNIKVIEKRGIKALKSSRSILFILYNNGSILYKAFSSNPLKLDVKDKFSRFLIDYSIKEFSMNYNHALAINSEDNVLAAGKNNFGQLAQSSKNDKKTFSKVWGLDRIYKIDTGLDFSGALNKSRKLFLWGKNEDKQIKIKINKYYDVPNLFKRIDQVKDFSLGRNHCIAINNENELLTWGNNDFGQLGNGHSEADYEINKINLPKIDLIHAGDEISFASTEEGSLYGWGKNGKNQITAKNTRVKNPYLIKEIKNPIKIISSDSIVVVVNEDGRIYTWGTFNLKKDKTKTLEKPYEIKGAESIKDIVICNNKIYVLTIEDEIYCSDHNLNLEKISISK
ncbi:MAG: RCC1 domain-containing protein [Bacillota bacterium]